MLSKSLFTLVSWNTFSLTLILILFGSILVACGGSNNSDSPSPPLTVAEQLQTALNQAVTAGIPGTALAIRGDSFQFTGVAGVKDLATMTPLNANHRFYLASVGKTYTAVATVRIAADGVLNLDDPINRWLPASVTDRIPSSHAITIRRLLNHTSGIFDFQNDGDEWSEQFQLNPNHQWTNWDVLPFFLDQPLHFAPGTDYRYSNSNYVLVALIAEAVTGLSIQEVIRYTVIEPNGLINTVHGNETVGLAGLVHGYADIAGERIDVYPWYSHFGVADGGIQASAADLAEFVRTVFTSDVVLNDAMRAELLKPSGLGNPPSGYGLGIQMVTEVGSESVIYGHSGKDPGYQADYIHVASANGSLTIALCASASFGDYDALYQNLLQSVLEILKDAEERA